MNVIFDGLDLGDAVMKVSKALGVKAANQALEGIKIIAKNDTLTFLASDLELSIQKTIKADVLMEGETVVVGKYFVEFASKLKNEQIELCHLDDGGLQIKYGDSESELQVYPVENYPYIEKDEDGNFIIMTQSELKDIVDKITFSCSNDDSRPILKGCLFEVAGGELTNVALDGFRMAVMKRKVETNGDFSAIIPARTLIEISRLLDKND